MKALFEHLMVLRDLAPEPLQTHTDDLEERDRRRFYAAAYDAVPKLHSEFTVAMLEAERGERGNLDIERFRRIRRVVRAAKAWAGRTADTEIDLARELTIACEELLVFGNDA